MSRRRPLRGFTLIEVLVALGIVALTLAAGARATASLVQNAERQADQTLAHLCAENTLIALRLAKQMPPVGENSQACDQAGRSFSVQVKVSATPNPNFMRVQAQVFEAETALLSLATVIGRF